MGNYRNVEIDFIERTLELISQYEGLLYRFKFDKQFNYTLLTNCLLGIIVFPKEKAISFLPKDRITEKLRVTMGINESTINKDYVDLQSFVYALRNSIAHFNIEFESQNEEFLIDRIVFNDYQKAAGHVVASFVPVELLSFIRYYGSWFVSNARKYRKDIYEAPS
ncbi:HEPN family nuclease [Dyadobacter arcticus]|uniref:pEK499-p136 HEPN domain-containing protein n=1 Tax=Dyadobacter arcticus TaxID=1078754 RepID=A0ABX0USN8_9BACT|nr:HEPN family nuclease [Dyadobacter arcticus]NIJ55423.1 hypothetical protein [Dyadobacter arcticus]